MPGIREHYPECPQALIVTLAKTGDQSAFEEIIRRKQSWVRNLLRRLSGNDAEADDLAQQVFLQMWRKLSSLKKVDAFDGWLKQVAISTWLQHIRKAGNSESPGDEPEDDAAPPIHPTPGIAIDLNQALAQLKPDVRLCVVLAYHGGLSHQEISDRAEIPLGTVKSHITRGTVRLRELLGDYHSSQKEADSD